MPCETVIDHIQAYVDGELPLALTERMDAHLASCGHCEPRVRHERAYRERMGRVQSPAPPTELAERQRHRIGGSGDNSGER